jgi:phosphohistidine phosphatase
MEIYVFRHGIAEDGGPNLPDADRALTDEGRRKVRDVAKTARRAGVEPSLVISSPYTRAVETAEIAIDELRYKGDLIRSKTLVPHGSPEKVWSELREHSGQSAILLAGHEPLLSHLVAYLLSTPTLRFEMKKAAMVAIEFTALTPSPHGILRWIIHPKLCS